ncbi:MAG: hypothetical protein O9350_21190 [Microcystis sp. LE19-388.1G]|nr:hypothetical protein [Microcystis sp. LE19-388.1G]
MQKATPPQPPDIGGVWGVGCGVWGETIHNLRVNHTRPLAKVLSRSLYSNIFEDYQLLINN